MKSHFLTVFVFLLSLTASAQIEADIIRPSINAEQFGMAVKAETALSKGQLSLNIPLMTLKGKGYDLPISLTFYGGDVIFSSEASPIGLGWALMAGGVITTTIRGQEDSLFGGAIQHHTNKDYISDRYNDRQNHSSFLDEILSDPMPDEYTYSLPGHSGTIEVSVESNTIRRTLFPDESYKIVSTERGYCITADDGTIFYFEDAESRTIGMGSNSTKSTSWFLTRIVTTKGGVFTFNYADEEYVDLSTADDSNLYFEKYSTKRVASIVSDYGSVLFDATTRDDRGPIGNKSITKGKESKRIYKIELRDENGSFVKGYELDNSGLFRLHKEWLEYQHCDWVNYRHKLSAITQYDSVGNRLPSYEFVYDYKFMKSKLADLFPYKNSDGDNLPRDSWTSCIGPQAYVDLDGIGNPLCWMGGPDSQLMPFEGITVRTENYAPTSEDYFCLTNIKYPTGATDEFTYEKHHYNKVNNTKASSSCGTQIQGRRLATKIHHGSELNLRTEYIYKLHDADYNVGSASSGILTNPSIHYATYYTPITDRGWIFRASRLTSGKTLNSFMGPPVCYTEVEEVERDENNLFLNKTIHYFEPQIVSPPVNYIFVYSPNAVLPSSDLVRIDNRIYGTKSGYTGNMSSYNNVNMTYITYPVGDFYNVAYTVDQPLKEVFIGKDGDVRSIKEYSYTWGEDYKKYGYKAIRQDYPDYTVNWISMSEYIMRKQRLESITTTCYYNNGDRRDSICEYYGVGYNKGRVDVTSYIRRNKSGYDHKLSRYYFPGDILNIIGSTTSPVTEGVNKLVEKNIVANPIKTIVKRNGIIIDGECKDYQMLSGMPLLKSIYKLKNTENNSDSAPIINGNDIDYRAELYKEGEVITYDENLNPEHVRLKNTQDRIYVWGYGGRFPIAVIDNMNGTTFQVSTNLKSQILQLATYTKIENEDVCTSLRNLNTAIRSLLPASAHITTYTYDPYFGMTSETDDSNLGTIFTYDTFGRLIAKYDANYKKLEEYNYHLNLQQ